MQHTQPLPNEIDRLKDVVSFNYVFCKKLLTNLNVFRNKISMFCNQMVSC